MLSQSSVIDNRNLFHRVTLLNRIDHILTLQHNAKHRMLAVEVRGRHRGDEELTAVGVLAGVRHGEEPRTPRQGTNGDLPPMGAPDNVPV